MDSDDLGNPPGLKLGHSNYIDLTYQFERSNEWKMDMKWKLEVIRIRNLER